MKDVTHVFFSEANHIRWGGKGTIEVTDFHGNTHLANYFGRAATDPILGTVPGDDPNTRPPSLDTYRYLGRMIDGVLK